MASMTSVRYSVKAVTKDSGVGNVIALNMGCSTSTKDHAPLILNTDNYEWTSHGLTDAFVEGRKYIFYKTKNHQRIVVLLNWIRCLTSFSEFQSCLSAQELIGCILRFLRYEPGYESEGNPNDALIVETNTVVVLPSDGLRIYKFKSLHIKPYGVLTATKWIDCDYHSNTGGVLRIDCSGSIRIDEHGIINMNGAGMTGLESDGVVRKYGGNLSCHQATAGGDTDDIYDESDSDHDSGTDDFDDDEKAEELMLLNVDKSSGKQDVYQFGSYFIAKGGSYAMTQGKRLKIYQGGCGGGCIALRCFDFINKGSVVANGTRKPKRVSRDKQMISKLKYFARNGINERMRMRVKVMDIGIDGEGGFISIHVANDFVNLGFIEAVTEGFIVVQQQQDRQAVTEGFIETKQLKLGRCRPYPKARGAELRQMPIDELL